jgi:hypothetical protein
MQQEIEFAVQEARTMQLTKEQTIKFIMKMTGCDYTTAKNAITKRYEYSY